jgi:hypothetical protein
VAARRAKRDARARDAASRRHHREKGEGGHPVRRASGSANENSENLVFIGQLKDDGVKYIKC